MQARLIRNGAAGGATNMAWDHALFEGVQAGGRPVLRLYRWSPACLSLGRNQQARGVYHAERAAQRGVDLVRRPTGGSAVYHHHELTYAVMLPTGLLGGPRAAYAALNRGIARGLQRLGVPAVVEPDAGRNPRARPAWPEGPCFQRARAGEIRVGGMKLVGSAQRTEAKTLLQHGSILLDGDQSEVLELMPAANGAAAPPACIGLGAVLAALPAIEEIEEAVALGIAAECGLELEPDEPTRAECEAARALTAHYRSDEWTFRR